MLIYYNKVYKGGQHHAGLGTLRISM